MTTTLGATAPSGTDPAAAISWTACRGAGTASPPDRTGAPEAIGGPHRRGALS